MTIAGQLPQTRGAAALEWRAIDSLKPYDRNARTHSKAQVGQIAESIRRFGFVNPVLIGETGEIVAGHGRVAAARQIGMTEVPVLRLAHLSEAERRAYVIADNRLAEKAGWDRELLALELQELIELEFEVELTGFGLAEIDLLLDGQRATDTAHQADEAADLVPEWPAGPPVTRSGDIWQLGSHRLICGDARDGAAVAALMAGDTADLIFTDPPYNVAIDGHVSGLGKTRHREFAVASGEMDRAAFTTFLTESFGASLARARPGTIAYTCMDWRHLRELLAAGDALELELKNLCVWNKRNAGMGSFYRSKHELILVWKLPGAPHTNSFLLGETGRYRTNVWDYAGANSFSSSRDADLAMHPTVKPVALIADAIRDCSRRGEIVLDPFGGSGSTLIAAETVGRRARLIEIDPAYCDTILARYQAFTGKLPRHVASGLDPEALVAARREQVSANQEGAA